jgi:hypothetical protein
MSASDLQQRRDSADNRVEEVTAQVEALLPAVAAQSLLNKGADELQDIVLNAIKKAPRLILSLITGV